MSYPQFSDYVAILNEPYQNHTIDLSIGFYGLCSYQPDAWDHVFASIRRYYPYEPIVLINDGFDQYDYTEMASKYNCTLLKKEREICLHWPDLEGTREFLNRTKITCDMLLKIEWLIHLHPDVICQGKISYPPPSPLCGVGCGSLNGQSRNDFSRFPDGQKLMKEIQNKFPNIEINGWGWCGGSIMHIPTFYIVYNSIFGPEPTINLETLRKTTWLGFTEHEDTLMSALFLLNGFQYRVWKDNPEHHRGPKQGAFLHGYKEHYDFKKTGMTTSQYYDKVRAEQIEKSRKLNLLKEGEYLK